MCKGVNVQRCKCAKVKNRYGKVIEVISVFYRSQPTYNSQMVEHNGPIVVNRVKNGVLGKLSDTSMHKVTEKHLNRDFIGIELNKEYFDIAECRINESDEMLDFS